IGNVRPNCSAMLRSITPFSPQRARTALRYMSSSIERCATASANWKPSATDGVIAATFYLVPRHAGFQGHVDDQLGARAAILRHRAADLGGKARFDGDHLAMSRRFHQGCEFEEGGRRLLEHHFHVTRVITVTLPEAAQHPTCDEFTHL